MDGFSATATHVAQRQHADTMHPNSCDSDLQPRRCKLTELLTEPPHHPRLELMIKIEIE